jgi:hypothetical protein
VVAAVVGELNLHNAAVVGVCASGHQAGIGEPPDELGHRRLGDSFGRGERGQPARA